jgi:hypothetical protein
MTEKDFINEMQQFLPDPIRSEYDLTKYNGALDLAKARWSCPDTSFIFVTVGVSEDRSIENTRKRHGWKSQRRP